MSAAQRYRVFIDVFLLLFIMGGHRVVAESTSGALNKPLEYTIGEEQPAGTVVGNVRTDSDLAKRYSPDDLSRMRFHIRHTSGNHETRDLFTIDESSGEIRTKRIVDRDQMCGGAESDRLATSCDVTFDVTVRPLSFFQIIRVLVHIVDINDNAPTFAQEHVTLHVTETTPPGTLFIIPSADDADSSVNGVQSYQIRSAATDEETGNGRETQLPFDLYVIDQVDGSKDVRLRLVDQLDRETTDRYSMIVLAIDGGQPVPLTGTLTIDVVVTDANDHSPQFDQNGTYAVDVNEDLVSGSLLVTVHASDKDDGLNGQVKYSWAEHTERLYGSLFAIDALSGQIHLKMELDYEREEIYQLTVKAVDRGVGSLPVYAKVTVRVRDVNDNAPTINVNSLSGTDVVQVREHLDPAGTFIAHISVSDADSDNNGQTECQLLAPNADTKNYFRLEPLPDSVAEYKLTTGVVFDRENGLPTKYHVTIECSDRGELVQQTSRRDIEIDVADVNDHAPQLHDELIEATVYENEPARTFVARINATDNDDGRNRALHYRLVPVDLTTNGQLFASGLVIDPITGVVTTNRSFDYESIPRDFRYLVIVSDYGEGPRTATATLHLVVLDVNDERPRFDRARYNCVVSENATVGSSVCRVVATDKDVTPAFRRTRYTMTSSSGTANTFNLDPSTGMIKTGARLDREQVSEYRLTVSASDLDREQQVPSSNEPLSTVEVHIVVEDENDNRPVFIFPPTASNTQVTLELRPLRRTAAAAAVADSDGVGEQTDKVQSGVGLLVTRLVAEDRDDGLNAELTYSITHGNEDGVFAVDPATGVIIVSPTGPGLDVDRLVYRLVVSVADRGNPRLVAVADLEVRVHVSTASELHSAAAVGSDDDKMNSNAIIMLVGLILGVVLVTSLIAVAIVYVRRHARRRRRHYQAVKRGEVSSSTAADRLQSVSDIGGPFGGGGSALSLGNRCSDFDCHVIDRPSSRNCGVCSCQDTDCCSVRCHSNDLPPFNRQADAVLATIGNRKCRPGGSIVCSLGPSTCDLHDPQTSLTTCSGDVNDDVMSASCYHESSERDQLHCRGTCVQCSSQRATMEIAGNCCLGDTINGYPTATCVHMTSLCSSMTSPCTAHCVQSPTCGSLVCQQQQQQPPQPQRLVPCSPARRPAASGRHHRTGRHHHSQHQHRQHHHLHPHHTTRAGDSSYGSGGSGSQTMDGPFRLSAPARHHHHQRPRALTGGSLGGGSSTCSRSSLSPSSDGPDSSVGQQSPTQSVRHLTDAQHNTSTPLVSPAEPLSLAIDSDNDAGNCSATDSGRGLSCEAVTEVVRMQTIGTRAQPCVDNRTKTCSNAGFKGVFENHTEIHADTSAATDVINKG